MSEPLPQAHRAMEKHKKVLARSGKKPLGVGAGDNIKPGLLEHHEYFDEFPRNLCYFLATFEYQRVIEAM